MIKRIRWALSLPLYIPQFIVYWLAGALIAARSLLLKATNGMKIHIWWVIIQGRRWVQGVPTWTVDDLLVTGIQPTTDAQRELAERDPRVVRLECGCGRPGCPNNGRYIGLPASAVPLSIADLNRIRQLNESLRDQAKQKSETEKSDQEGN